MYDNFEEKMSTPSTLDITYSTVKRSNPEVTHDGPDYFNGRVQKRLGKRRVKIFQF